MKPPTDMRNGEFSGNPKSSAYGLESVRSDYIGAPYRSQHKAGYLVSAKYSRRQSVKFLIPEKEAKVVTSDDKFKGDLLNITSTDNNIANSTSGLNSLNQSLLNQSDSVGLNKSYTNILYSNDSDEEGTDARDTEFELSAERRMSATELPPILNGANQHGLITTNGNITSRSNTFHNYKFNLESRNIHRKSVHSDSSLQGYKLTTQSRTSSSSSQGRGRVLSAGTDRRTNKYVPSDLVTNKPPITTLKLNEPNGVVRNGEVRNGEIRNGMRNGMKPNEKEPVRCSSVIGTYRRTKSKISINNITTPRKLQHSKSEHTLVRNGTIDQQQPLSIKRQRNSSERSLTDMKKNVKNTENNMRNDKNSIASKHKTSQNTNLNGLRRFSSTLGLNTKDEHRSDADSAERDDVNNDSDSDSEKDQRVMNWIIGVNAEAEPPEEPTIEYVDEPPQRDTAIRIVYEGDS